ncbi:hypothetical protein [Alloactinosynnema sp. L-07]|nr:hypothetical protein [Alloactinosynnema sp. L-07]
MRFPQGITHGLNVTVTMALSGHGVTQRERAAIIANVR